MIKLKILIEIDEMRLKYDQNEVPLKLSFYSCKKYWIVPPTNRIIRQHKLDIILFQKIVLCEIWELFQIMSSGSGALSITTILSLTVKPL